MQKRERVLNLGFESHNLPLDSSHPLSFYFTHQRGLIHCTECSDIELGSVENCTGSRHSVKRVLPHHQVADKHVGTNRDEDRAPGEERQSPANPSLGACLHDSCSTRFPSIRTSGRPCRVLKINVTTTFGLTAVFQGMKKRRTDRQSIRLQRPEP